MKVTKERAEEIEAAWGAATSTERLRLPRLSWVSVGDGDTSYFENKPSELELSAAERIADLERENAELRSLIRATPVLLLDAKVCAARGEDEALKYARDLVEWKKRVDAIQL